MTERRFDNTCSKCQAEKRGTYDLPVRCTNCGASGIGVFSKGHESYYSESCPDCECQTLRVNHSWAKVTT